MIRVAAVVAICATLVGCPGATVVERHTITYATLDPSWIVPCPVVPPPLGDAYTKATERERNIMWSQVYTQQMYEMTLCNQRLGHATGYNDEKSKTVIVK